MHLLAFLVAAGYLPGVVSATVVGRWAAIGLLAPVFLLWAPRVHMTVGHWLGLAFLFVSYSSIAWSVDPWTTTGECIHLTMLAAVFLLGASRTDLPWTALGWGVAANLPFLLLQYYGYHPVVIEQGLSGLFLNRDVLSEIAFPVTLAMAYQRRLTLMTMCAVCAVLPGSREIVLSGSVLLVYASVWRWGWKAILPELAALISLLIFFFWHDVNIAGRAESYDARLVMWQVALANLHWIGWGSYQAIFPLFVYAHNEFIHFAFELGVLSLLIWALFLWCLKGKPTLNHYVLLPIVVGGSVDFPLHMPATAFLAALMAGSLSAHHGRTRAAKLESRNADQRGIWRPEDASASPGRHGEGGAAISV